MQSHLSSLVPLRINQLDCAVLQWKRIVSRVWMSARCGTSFYLMCIYLHSIVYMLIHTSHNTWKHGPLFNMPLLYSFPAYFLSSIVARLSHSARGGDCWRKCCSWACVDVVLCSPRLLIQTHQRVPQPPPSICRDPNSLRAESRPWRVQGRIPASEWMMDISTPVLRLADVPRFPVDLNTAFFLPACAFNLSPAFIRPSFLPWKWALGVWDHLLSQVLA